MAQSEHTPDGISRVARRGEGGGTTPPPPPPIKKRDQARISIRKRTVWTLTDHDQKTVEGGIVRTFAACGKRSLRKMSMRLDSDCTDPRIAAGTAESAS